MKFFGLQVAPMDVYMMGFSTGFVIAFIANWLMGYAHVRMDRASRYLDLLLERGLRRTERKLKAPKEQMSYDAVVDLALNLGVHGAVETHDLKKKLASRDASIAKLEAALEEQKKIIDGWEKERHEKESHNR